MTALSVLPPYPAFTDTAGNPLEAGYILIGVAGQNPYTNPVAVFWDAAMTIPAAQPIRTVGGFPSYNGSPGMLYVDSDYSIMVLDRNRARVYSSPNATGRYSEVVVSLSYVPVGGASTVRTIESKFAESISLLDFMTEEERDNVTSRANSIDVTTKVQAAFDYAYANNISTIIAPPGIYRLSTAIRAKRYVCLQGAGAYTQFFQSGDTSAFVFDEAVEGVLGREIKFKDLFITKATKTSTVCYGIRLRGTTNNIWGAHIEGVTISKFYDGCQLVRPIVTYMCRNEFEDNYNDGCAIQGDGTSVTYVNNWGRVNGGYGLRVTGQLVYSHFDTSACDGNTLGGYFFGKNAGAAWPFGITLNSPGAEANGGDGLKIEDGENFTINGGYFYLNGGDGMEFTGARGVVVNGSKCLTNTGWQVRASTSSTPKVPSNIVLTGCSLSASGLGRISDTTIVSEVLSPDSSTVRFARPLDALTLAQNGVTIMNGSQVLQNLGVGSTTYHWIKQVINYTDLAAAALTANFNLSQTVPDASYIVDCVFQLNTEFSGGAVASATIQIGDTGVSNRYIPATNVFTGAGTGYKATNVTDRGAGLYDAVTRSLRHPVFTGVRTLRVTLTTTGANTNALTAGQITVWFGIIKLP